MLGINDIIFIIIYFIVFFLILASNYVKRVSASDAFKSLAVAVVARIAIIIVIVVLSALSSPFGIPISVVPIAYLVGAWISIIMTRSLWEEKVRGNKAVNLVVSSLVIAIILTDIILRIIASL